MQLCSKYILSLILFVQYNPFEANLFWQTISMWQDLEVQFHPNPMLDKLISVRPSPTPLFVLHHARTTAHNSETGLIGELWLKE